MPTSSVCDSLVGVDGLVEFTSVEEVLQQFLHLRNARRASDQHDVMDARLVHLGVAQRLLHRLQGAAEQVGVQLLKPGASDARVEVDAFKQRIDLDRRLDTMDKQYYYLPQFCQLFSGEPGLAGSSLALYSSHVLEDK